MTKKGHRQKSAAVKKKSPVAKKKAAAEPDDVYTFMLDVCFQMQYSFVASELHLDGPDDPDPEIRQKALKTLEREITEYLLLAYPAEKVEVLDDTWSSCFLGRS